MPADSPSVPPSGGQGYQRGPHDATCTPRDLKLKLEEQRLIIDWQDGSRSAYALAELRRVCPCAACRGEHEQHDANPLKILKSDPSDLRATDAKLVGNYAIRFTWSDGHDTGIFDFRFLRALANQ